jgi:hypothetical protein
MPSHATAERRSLRYHEAIAKRVAADPTILARARARTQRWLIEARVPEYYARGWEEILSGSPKEICVFLVDPSERARAFRQVSPFAGALGAKERWRLWAAESDRDDAPAT